MTTSFDKEVFEKMWTQLGKEICQAVYVQPKSQELKNILKKNGYLNSEQMSEFIDVCDAKKYECIYAKFGPEGSEGYKQFSDEWNQWFQLKGVSSTQARGQRNSVDHILFGSTPDPVQFLLHFEEEMLGSMSQ